MPRFSFCLCGLLLLCGGCDAINAFYPQSDGGLPAGAELDQQTCDDAALALASRLNRTPAPLPVSDDSFFPLGPQNGSDFLTQAPDHVGWFGLNVDVSSPAQWSLHFSEGVSMVEIFDPEGTPVIVAGGTPNLACPEEFNSAWTFEPDTTGLHRVRVVDHGTPFYVFFSMLPSPNVDGGI